MKQKKNRLIKIQYSAIRTVSKRGIYIITPSKPTTFPPSKNSGHGYVKTKRQQKRDWVTFRPFQAEKDKSKFITRRFSKGFMLQFYMISHIRD